jgi:hypothetical protein
MAWYRADCDLPIASSAWRLMSEFVFRCGSNVNDDTPALPALILPAVQVNIRGGRLLPARDDGRRYLSLPLDAL